MDWRHVGELNEAGDRVYGELKNLIVWVKDNGGMGHSIDPVMNSSLPTRSELQPMSTISGWVRTVATAPMSGSTGVSTPSGRIAMTELVLHPTVKPVAMIADAIKDVSIRGGIVLDAFGGSGSTLIAAHKTDGLVQRSMPARRTQTVDGDN